MTDNSVPMPERVEWWRGGAQITDRDEIRLLAEAEQPDLFTKEPRIAQRPVRLWAGRRVVQPRAGTVSLLLPRASTGSGPRNGEDSMSAIELIIPLELTTELIIRSAENIDKSDAHALAVELHDIIARVQQFYADRPRILTDGRPQFEAAHLVWTILRCVLNFWPEDESRAAGDAVWIALIEPMGDLYDRYLRLCDRIDGSNVAEMIDHSEDPRARPQ